ncbi:hypothetical protein [Martelella limonii]|uniref:hypothetical protein n=1 Tax=Martelella limonii TaxID=1647649 RepID=UPI0015806BF2|nr:hypothetical protein [Martelella limonii]
MHDVFLKFADHAEALAALQAAGAIIPPDEDGRIACLDTGLPDGMTAIKAVGAGCDGVVLAGTVEWRVDMEASEQPALAPVPGFHVNLRLAEDALLPASLSAFIIVPPPVTPAETFS